MKINGIIAGRVVGVLLSLVWVGGSSAQDSDPLGVFRSRSEFTSEDDTSIDRHIAAQISDLESNIDKPVAVRKFISRMREDFSHRSNQAGFKSRFAQRSSVLFSDKFKSGGPVLGRALSSALAGMSDFGALNGLKQALGSADEATRLLAANGIYNLRRSVEAEQGQAVPLISWLKDAAVREGSGAVLQRLYDCFSLATERTEQGRAILAILQSRLSQLENDTIAGSWAEESALIRLQELSDSWTDADRKQAVELLAKFMVHYTHRYFHADLAPSIRRTELGLLALTERTLARLTGAPSNLPGVSLAAGSVDGEREEKTAAALYAWVGSTDQTGFLNGGGWQVPRHAGIQNRSFKSATSPAGGSTSATP